MFFSPRRGLEFSSINPMLGFVFFNLPASLCTLDCQRSYVQKSPPLMQFASKMPHNLECLQIRSHQAICGQYCISLQVSHLQRLMPHVQPCFFCKACKATNFFWFHKCNSRIWLFFVRTVTYMYLCRLTHLSA